MKLLSRMFALSVTLLMLISFAGALAIDDGFYSVYTYNYDYWEEIRESPDAYKVKTVLYGSTLGLDVNFSAPEGLFVQGNDIYVCDTGNNRIVHIVCEGGEYKLAAENAIISEIKNIENAIEDAPARYDASGDYVRVYSNKFSSPTDCAVDEEGNIYVSDKGNNRVVKVDRDLNFLMVFDKPEDASFDAGSFNPTKIAVDVAGRVYVLAENVNKGLMKYESNGKFTGYIGANRVTMSTFEYIWKYFFLSDEQRSTTEKTVPTRYENIYMDPQGFIYATTTNFEEYDLKWDNAKPIRRLNGIGDDILIKDDRYPPIGDYTWVEGGDGDHGPSKFVDITVLENDVYVAFDKTRGRLFGYDSQGVMLWAFGAKGQYEGAFNLPSAMDHIGRDLVFTPTEYGNLVYDAIDAYSKGDYSSEPWELVLKFNANYNMAYRGIGRALLRQGKYTEAMDYFKMAHDQQNYGRAFRLYRKEWVEKNIWWVMTILGVLIVVWLGRRIIKNMKMEVAAYERDHVAK